MLLEILAGNDSVHCHTASLLLSGMEENLPDDVEGKETKYFKRWGFPGGTVVKNPLGNAGAKGSSPGLGRSYMPGATKPVLHKY